MPRIIGFIYHLFFLLYLVLNVNAVLQSQRSLASAKPSNPCVHGKQVNGKCICQSGWSGPYCENCFGRQKLETSQYFFTDGNKNYTASSRCTWIINDSNNTTNPLLLNMDQFLTECCWDHLYIYDGDSAQDNLLAVLSGDQKGKQVSISSGKAIVYFVSDLAYNLEGFNIALSWEACLKNCSNNGECNHGKCSCNTGFTGAACDIPICQNDGQTEPCIHGVCEHGKCKCTEKVFNGDYCQGFNEAVWDYVHTNGEFIQRASHALTMDNDDNAWIFGGFYFNKKYRSNRDLVKYNFKSKSFTVINSVNTPPSSRYDHSLVYYNNHLYLFGGVINDKDITNEFWSFNILTSKWTLLSSHKNSELAFPKQVAGHTAHVINGEMFIFFGYNPYEEYLYRPQIYNFGSNKWEYGPEHESIVGRFGHSSSLYFKDKDPVILIYGGYTRTSQEPAYNISNDLLLFDISTKTWEMLNNGMEKVFHHTSVVIDDQLIIIGGNKHNESSNIRSNNCFSDQVISYDILCRRWSRLNVNSGNLEVSRYGHVSSVYGNDIYLFGGFNGLMKNDVLKLSMPQCNILASSIEECAESAIGIRCVFVDKKCTKAETDVSYKQSFTSLIKNGKSTNNLDNCFEKRFDVAQNLHNSYELFFSIKSSQCSEHKDCHACFLQKDCGWCESTMLCVNSDTGCADGSAFTSDSKICLSRSLSLPKKIERSCSLAHNCFACQQLDNCVWYVVATREACISTRDELLILDHHNKIQSERLAALNHGIQSTLSDFHVYFTNNDGNSSRCPLPCSSLDDCSSCTQQNCMWCPSTKRCVSMDSYMINFPYGQCQSWITQANSNNNHACQSDPSDCSLQKTCEECQNIGPRCGWCDNGQGTGVGECLPGSPNGPSNKTACKNPHSWYFTGHPSCQCNGHSKCNQTNALAITGELCNRCDDHTEGEHCERCEDGYFGDPRNGGNCTECQCNDQAYLCDNENGDCFCTTKGVSGAHCDKCEKNYEGDPKNNKPCSYKLNIDFIFTFKLDNNEDKDRYVNRINFFAIPFKDDTDVQFSITCEGEYPAAVDLNMTRMEANGEIVYKKLMASQDCDANGFKRIYQANNHDFPFGTIKNTTFHVMVHNFTTPIKIQISFAQSPPINWVLFFVIFAACFVVLLVVAGLVWIVKQRVERYQLMQSRHIEITRMAARPFGEAYLDLSPCRYDSATPISVEPCSNLQTGIYTLIVRLPTGGKNFTPHGTSGLAVASSLCNLTQSQLAILSPDDDSKDQDTNQKSHLRRFINFKNPFSRAN